ncbi:MAG: hypothetical protein IKQ97_01620 [Eubacterium sp.]|nr:hypothetical protein [Eubacterium sp.]
MHRSAPSVSIEGCEKLSESINGSTYRLQKEVLVKVFNWKIFIRTYLGVQEEDSVEEKRMNQLLTQYYILKEDLLNGLAALN